MALNPPTQYANDANLRARQRLWEHQQPPFDIVGWVLDLAGLADSSGRQVLDVGCGNGAYLRELEWRRIQAVGCDLSAGMLASTRQHPRLVNGDVTALPFRGDAFDVVLAPHMLYHVDDREAAAIELRRVLRSTGCCVIVTNGEKHMSSLRSLVEAAVRKATPTWAMRNPSTHAFSLENGEAQLRSAFEIVACIRPTDVTPVRITDAAPAAEYVASVADHYQRETTRPWGEIVEEVRIGVQQEIDKHGHFVVVGDTGAFVCR